MPKAPDPKPRWSRAEKALLTCIPAFTLAWALVVGLSGYDVNLFGVEWDFERTGQLGDSFGVVGALMATAAAAFTFLTLQGERTENSRLRAREDDRDRADRKREAEATFFRLLDLRNSILERVRDPSLAQSREVEATFFRLLNLRNLIPERVRDPSRAQSSGQVLGQRAIWTITKGLAQEVASPQDDVQSRHDAYWSKVEGEVGHYLRFTYHIVRFATEQFDNDRDRYGYVRLLRAQLSNAEVELIALNSAYGAGKPRMKTFVERYALLHSLPEDTIERLQLRSLFSDAAFDSDRWVGASSEPDV